MSEQSSSEVKLQIGWSFIITVLGIMIPVNLLFSVTNAAREIWSRRKVIAYHFKKIVLGRTEVIRLRQEEKTNATEENLNSESHALPTSRGI